VEFLKIKELRPDMFSLKNRLHANSQTKQKRREKKRKERVKKIKILQSGFRATLTFQNFKVALNPQTELCKLYKNLLSLLITIS